MAVELVDVELVRRRVPPVDRGWLQIQKARALLEVGDRVEARQLAKAVYKLRDRFPRDVTAAGLSSVAASLLFNTSDWNERDLAQVITASDTAARWWITQTQYSGLVAGATKSFDDWARKRTFTIGGGSPETNKLVAAAFVSSTMGDQGAWGHISSLVGKRMLMQPERFTAQSELRDGLERICMGGDERGTADAARAMVEDGPAEAVRELALAKDVELSRVTRSTAAAVLALLQAAGDVLDSPTANKTVRWILETLSDGREFVQRTSPTYLVPLRLAEVLAAVLPSASPRLRQSVARWLADPPEGLLELEQEAFAGVAFELRREDWSERSRMVVRRQHDPRASILSLWVRVAAAATDEEAVQVLLPDLEAGLPAALRALGDVRKVPERSAAAVVNKFSERVRTRIEKAVAGSISFGGGDHANDLAILNVWHTGHADWETLVRFLESEQIPPSQKQGALLALARYPDRLPAPALERVVSVAEELAEANLSELFSPFESQREAWAASAMFSAAAHAASEATTDRRLVRLLAERVDQKRWVPYVASLLGRGLDAGLDVALVFDPDPRIRSAASYELAKAVAGGDGGSLASEALRRAISDQGTTVPYFVASAPKRA